MTWQDITITTCLIFLSYALLPQIILGFKKKKPFVTFQTSLITTIGMIVLGITDLTLGLFFSGIASFIIGIFWATLLVQSQIYKTNSQ